MCSFFYLFLAHYIEIILIDLNLYLYTMISLLLPPSPPQTSNLTNGNVGLRARGFHHLTLPPQPPNELTDIAILTLVALRRHGGVRLLNALREEM